MGQIEKRGANTYRLVVSYGFDSRHKRQKKYKTIKLSSTLTEKQIQQELAAQMDKFEKEIQKGTYLDGNITLSEFSEKWMKNYAEVNLKPKTFIFYKKILKRVLTALGHKKLDSIQPTHLMEFYKNLGERGIRLDYMYTLKENIIDKIANFEQKASKAQINHRTLRQILNGKNTNKSVAEKICAELKMTIPKLFDIVNKEKKLSSITINHYHRLISTMMNTAVQWQLIIANPADRVKSPAIKRKKAKYYDIDEVEQMFTFLENEPLKYKVMIQIVIFCGLRLGELTAIEWTDINFDDETITVSKQLQHMPGLGTYEIDSAKSESGNRTVSMPARLTNLLKEYKIRQDEKKIKYGNKWIETNKLFTKDNGELIFPDTPSRWFKKFIKRTNLPQLTFHQLRHTNAALLISMGIDAATISRRLGHSKISTTTDIYGHALKRCDKEAADKLGNLIKG